MKNINWIKSKKVKAAEKGQRNFSCFCSFLTRPFINFVLKFAFSPPQVGPPCSLSWIFLPFFMLLFLTTFLRQLIWFLYQFIDYCFFDILESHLGLFVRRYGNRQQSWIFLHEIFSLWFSQVMREGKIQFFFVLWTIFLSQFRTLGFFHPQNVIIMIGKSLQGIKWKTCLFTSYRPKVLKQKVKISSRRYSGC